MKLLVSRFTLVLTTPMHIGSGRIDPQLDAPVVRDAFGDYRIPGSSITGALRAHADSLGLDQHFGLSGNEENCASDFEFSDGFLLDWDGTPTITKHLNGENVAMPQLLEVQEHVSIDHESGAASETGKFDEEIIPQGLRFACEIVLAQRSCLGEDSAHRALAALLTALSGGEFQIGADATSGLGIVQILKGSLSIGEFDLANSDGLTAARNRSVSIHERAGGKSIPLESLGSQISPSQQKDETISGRVVVTFVTDGPVLVGGSQRPRAENLNNPSAGADLVFAEARVADYKERKFLVRPWIPGSSLKGAIRHRIQHVFEALGLPDVQARMDALFGSTKKDSQHASLISIGGQVLELDEKRTLVQHVAIDRLTGGSLQGALYSEAPIWRNGLEISITICLNKVNLEDAAALAHAIIDMGIGELPIGGGTRRGNGRLLFKDSTGGFMRKAIKFNLDVANKNYSNATSQSEIDTLIDLIESANAEMAQKTSGAKT